MIRVLLAEDVHMIRGALAALIDLESDLEVVVETDRGDMIVPEALKHRPDVAIIDVDLPRMNGIEAARRLRETLPDCRTLILTGLDRSGVLRQALGARVSGYLLKDSPPSRLADAIRKVVAGHRVIDPQLMLEAWDDEDNPLTEREVEVFRLAADGAEPAEIAATLHLSVGTVRNYLSSVVTKLNARNRVDAIRIARDSGWLI